MATPISIVPRRPRATGDTGKSPPTDQPGPPAAGIPLAILASVFFAVASLIHLQTLGHGFQTSWDDQVYVTSNPWIRGLTPENIRFAFTTPYFYNYLPLHLVSYMVDYSIWGLNPIGFHLQSVVLAGLNAALAFVMVRRLFGSLALAAVAALLYAVHPSHVEAVAWISIRKDLLSTFFLFLTVILYDEATRDRFRPARYAGSVATFLLGLLSKLSISPLPIFLLVLEATRRREGRALNWKRAIATMIPYGALAFVLVLVNNQAQAKTQLLYAQQPLHYLMVKGHAVWMYLGLLTGIIEGRPIYDMPWVGGVHGPLGLAGLLVLPAVLWFGYRRGLRTVTLGAAWLFVFLLPVLVFPLTAYMADRYLYAPSLGFCWIVAAGIVALARRMPSQAGRTAALVALTAIPCTLFVAQTLRYEGLWKDPEALWTYASRRSTDKRAITNLAQVLLAEKRYDEAEQLYLKVSRGNSVDVWAGLAVVYYNTGRFDEALEAIDHAQKAIDENALAIQRMRPEERATIYYTRGLIEWIREDRDAAVRDWEAAVRVFPRHGPARARLRSAGVEPPPLPPR